MPENVYSIEITGFWANIRYQRVFDLDNDEPRNSRQDGLSAIISRETGYKGPRGEKKDNEVYKSRVYA